MKTVLIGAGNLATNLGRALLEAGHDILQVYSRTMESAMALAPQVGGAPTNDLNSIVRDADAYIVAVKDSALVELIPKLCKGRENAVFMHTAGSMPIGVFQGMAFHYGVLYPMQTFSKSRQADFSKITCFIEANDAHAMKVIRHLAETTCGATRELSSEERRHLHLAAVFACNFVNHCYEISSEILERHDIPFEVMLPLIDETARKVHDMSPMKAQTGPAVRYDENVIREQARMLHTDPFARDIYERMSLNIYRKYKNKGNSD